VILTPSGPDQPLAISGMESLGLLLMHEVNNVLTTLAGFAEFHLSLELGRGELEEPLRDAVRLARRSATIIEFLRQLAQRQGLDEESRHESPNRPLEELTEVAGWLVENRHKLEVELEADPTPLPLKPNLVRLALLNLLMNALKALGTLPGRIGISSREGEGGVLLTISDSGPGIAPEARERIFRQGVTSGRGLGLGLALVKEVALRHGGNVEVEQEGEQGVRVSLRLPRTP
jgi:signal transduction histidine kinase